MRSRIAAASIFLLVAALPLAAQVSGGPSSETALDPAQNRPSQIAVASADGMNVYSGTVVLDGRGEAWVIMPASFEPLNQDFSYQLTAIGAPAPRLYIAQKLSGNHFKIAGGRRGMEVSWQVTGIRRNEVARAADSTPVVPEKREAEVASIPRPAAPTPAAPASPSPSAPTPAPSPIPMISPSAPAAVPLTGDDIAAIKDMLERQFKDAFESRSMSEMQKLWPDMPRVARNDIANLFQSSDVQDIRMDLKCMPAVTGDRVLAYCSQIFSFSLERKAQAPLQLSVVYRLRRTGTEWHLENSRRNQSASPRGLSD